MNCGRPYIGPWLGPMSSAPSGSTFSRFFLSIGRNGIMISAK